MSALDRHMPINIFHYALMHYVSSFDEKSIVASCYARNLHAAWMLCVETLLIVVESQWVWFGNHVFKPPRGCGLTNK